MVTRKVSEDRVTEKVPWGVYADGLVFTVEEQMKMIKTTADTLHMHQIMDISRTKAQLVCLQAILADIEQTELRNSKATSTRGSTLPPLHGSFVRGVRDLQCAAEGEEGYLISVGVAPVLSMVQLLASRCGILDALVDAGGEPLTVAEIAEQCSIKEDIALRILRALASALRLCDSPSPGQYSANALTQASVAPLHKMIKDLAATMIWPLAGTIDTYLQHHTVNDIGTDATPWHVYYGADMWEVLARDAHMKEVFDKVFSARAEMVSTDFWSICDIDGIPASSKATGDVAVVDVGGNRGHDLKLLAERRRDYSDERYILQDLPETISNIPSTFLPSNITAMAYDFFSGPQPIQNAKVYFLHNVLHDHSDENCQIILRNIRSAMAPESRIILVEWVPREQYAQIQACTTDLVMALTTSGGKERSLAQWNGLLGGVGLEVVRAYEGKWEGEGVIEVRRTE